MASNRTQISDEDGDFPDWIEIGNNDLTGINLEDHFLTDSSTNLTKWRIPAVVIAPGEQLVIFASEKDRSSGELHTNFKLSAGGEFLALVAPDGTTILDAFDPGFPPVGQDVSFGISDSGTQVFFNDPTPGAANGSGSSNFVEPPVFSHGSQLFPGSLSLSITNPAGQGSIRFTTDGSVPDVGSPSFSEAISITGSATIKALITIPAMGESRIVTAHFARIDPDLADFDSNLPITIVDADSAVTNSSNAEEPKHDLRIFIIPVDPATGRASITSPAQVVTRAGANVRGNTSNSKEKKNYNVEFWNEREQDFTHASTSETIPQGRSKKVLDMPTESDWVLYGNDLAHERSYFNNPFIYSLARDIGYPAPLTRYCEAFLNPGGATIDDADYRGIYMWVERIKVDKNRVDLNPFQTGESDPVLLGGFIFRMNDTNSADLRFRTRQPYNTPTHNGNYFSFFSPKPYDVGHPLRNTSDHPRAVDRDNLRTYLSDFEDALFGEDFADPITGYARYVDPRTFFVYHSLQELAANNDMYHASVYLHKDVGGRVEMSSLWDFDWAFTRGHSVVPAGGNAYLGWWYNTPVHTAGRDNHLAAWFLRMMKDPEYQSDWNDFWSELRRSELSDASVAARLDALAAQLTEATVRDRAKFGGIPMTQQVSEMKSWIAGRATWMDSELGGLPPTFSLSQGIVSNGSQVTIDKGAGQPGVIYYTLDHSDPRLPEAPTGGVPTTLIPREDLWEYLDDGSDAGTAWRNISEGWSTGQAELGYGDNVGGFPTENTVVAGGPTGNRYITTYFRKAITIDDVSAFNGMKVRLRADDGAVVYANGNELFRTNMPSGTVDYLTEAIIAISGNGETQFAEYSVDLNEFQTGSNIIAVEIHQDRADSSDISFDLELLASVGGDGGGGPAPSALTSPNPLPISGIVTVNARSFDGNNWSPLSRATFIAGGELANASNLAVSEVHYHPRVAEPEFGEVDASEGDFEFIELTNIGSIPIDLAGIAFVDGVELATLPVTPVPLAVGERAVAVDNLAAFRSRYGDGPRIVGNYTGNLSNSGENITLKDAGGSVIEDFTYDDGTTWHLRTDGIGSSLERIDNTVDVTSPANWRPSVEVHGSPGFAGVEQDLRIVINEYLASSLPPVVDTIEFLNTTGSSIDISGWYVSDSSDLRKYQFPSSTSMEAGALLSIDESNFNPGGGTSPTDFALNGAMGDQIWLVETDASNRLLRFVDGVEFEPTPTNQSFGRIPDGIGTFQGFTNTSLGLSNSSSYEGWATSAFPSGTTIANALPDADLDLDGLSNLLEFLLGLDPAKTSAPPLTIEASDLSSIVLSYSRRKPLSGYRLIVAHTDGLATWDQSESDLFQDPGPVEITPTSELVTDEFIGVPTPRRFFRLVAIPAPGE